MVKTDQQILRDIVTVATACRRHYAQNRAVLSVDSAAFHILHRRFEIRALQFCCDFVNDDTLPGNLRAYRAAQRLLPLMRLLAQHEEEINARLHAA
ncbi:MAG: hypothetical protein H0W08_20645 [Acidobacteria bacterium]|nr:hypothetical protein [Acidobacteriota bacterium]